MSDNGNPAWWKCPYCWSWYRYVESNPYWCPECEKYIDPDKEKK